MKGHFNKKLPKKKQSHHLEYCQNGNGRFIVTSFSFRLKETGRAGWIRTSTTSTFQLVTFRTAN